MTNKWRFLIYKSLHDVGPFRFNVLCIRQGVCTGLMPLSMTIKEQALFALHSCSSFILFFSSQHLLTCSNSQSHHVCSLLVCLNPLMSWLLDCSWTLRWHDQFAWIINLLFDCDPHLQRSLHWLTYKKHKVNCICLLLKITSHKLIFLKTWWGDSDRLCLTVLLQSLSGQWRKCLTKTCSWLLSGCADVKCSVTGFWLTCFMKNRHLHM